MTFYNRNEILYVRINGRRLSTRLPYNEKNKKLVASYYRNDEFFNKFDLKKETVPDFVDLCTEVLDKKEAILKPTSYVSYLSLYNSKIFPFFKSYKVNEIRRRDIEKYLNTFSDRSTLNICYTLLKATFDLAFLREYIDFVPLIPKPRIKQKEHQIKPFSIDEINLILNTCKDKQFKNMLGIAFFTGMRIGEIYGLKWSDLDFVNYTISIKRTITKGYIQTPKTPSSIRTIDMLSQAEFYLKEQKKLTALSKFIFVKPRGYHYKSSCELLHKWKKILKDCSLEYRNFHQTRHSFASNMLSNFEDLNWVAYTLGHKSPKITLDKYSRYVNTKRDRRKTTFLDDTLSAQVV